MRSGFSDVCHQFLGENESTMLKTKKKGPWRPDKIVMQRPDSLDGVMNSWKCISTRIVGAESRPAFSEIGERPELIFADGKVRTPSDHMGILAELVYRPTQ